jgi:hypothetical protein
VTDTASPVVSFLFAFNELTKKEKIDTKYIKLIKMFDTKYTVLEKSIIIIIIIINLNTIENSSQIKIS